MNKEELVFPTDTIKGHRIYLVRELTEVTPLVDTDTDGNVILSYHTEIVDVHDTKLICETCDLEALDLYETHEISTEWQAY